MSVPLLCRLYVGYFEKRNSKRDLPKPADRYFVDGYPRSGNTFTKGLIVIHFLASKQPLSLHSASEDGFALQSKKFNLIS